MLPSFPSSQCEGTPTWFLTLTGYTVDSLDSNQRILMNEVHFQHHLLTVFLRCLVFRGDGYQS